MILHQSPHERSDHRTWRTGWKSEAFNGPYYVAEQLDVGVDRARRMLKRTARLAEGRFLLMCELTCQEGGGTDDS